MPTVSNDSILIRALTSRDVPKVKELHSKLLPVQYPSSFFLQLLLLPNRACFVAYKRGHPNHPIGFISAAIHQPPSTAGCFTTFVTLENPPTLDLSRPEDSTITDLSKLRLEILTLGVLPAYQRCSLARGLVNHTVDNFRESCARNPKDGTVVYANVAASNLPAIRFYERMGMSISADIIRNLYRTLSYGSKDAYLVVGVI